MGHTLLCVCPILVSISAGPRSPDQLLRGFHGGDDRRFLFIFKGSGISDHPIITLAEAFDRKVFAKIHDLIFPIVRDEHQIVRIQAIDRACDGFFLLASFRGTARRTADSQKQNCAQGQSQQNPMGCFTFHINTPFRLYSAIVS